MNSPKIRYKNDFPVVTIGSATETRLVVDAKISDGQRPEYASGLGDFVYMAHGVMEAGTGVPLHPHENLDVISVMLSGSLYHEGTLSHEESFHGPGAIVQRSGTGMRHSEWNRTEEDMEVLQIWFQPPHTGLTPEARYFAVSEGNLQSIIGGDQNDTLPSNTHGMIGLFQPAQTLTMRGESLLYLVKGRGLVNGTAVEAGALVSAPALEFQATTDSFVFAVAAGDAVVAMH